MQLRDLIKMTGPNDGRRTLAESIMVPELVVALRGWIADAANCGVLIGGVALSYYVKPRTTQVIDVLFLSGDEIPERVVGFKKTRASAFQHDHTHVEIEAITPQLVNADPALIARVIETAQPHDGIAVASPAGLVAMKLGRLSLVDRADVGLLIKYGVRDVSQFPLGAAQRRAFEELIEIVDREA